MNTPALLVAFLRPTPKPPLWAPPGSCIIMRGLDGWTLGPKKRSPKGDPLLVASVKHAYDLGDSREVQLVIKDWKASMPRGRGIAWDVWAWQTKSKSWVRP